MPSLAKNKSATFGSLTASHGCGLVLLVLLAACGDDSLGSFFPADPAMLSEVTNLPIVIIGTGNKEIPDPQRVVAGMRIVVPGESEQDHHRGLIDIEIRGQTSSGFPKKPYGFSTLDNDGDEVDVSLLGMPAESDWILNGPYIDRTLIRNVLVYGIANQMGRYATKTRFVELFINDAYHGVYVLMEKIKRDKQRVAISKTNSEKDGGYILKIDKGDDSGFASDFGTRYKYVYPKGRKITDAQERRVQDIVGNFEQSIADRSYSEQIDVGSFIDYLIISEITKNVDAYRLSTYLHVDPSKGIKVTMGPVWDYNVALGNARFCQGPDDGKDHSVDMWAYDHHEYCARGDGDGNIPTWWDQLLGDSAFRAKVVKRWNALRTDVLDREKLYLRIDQYVAELGEAVARDFETWSVAGEKSVAHEDEVAHLKDWISNRLKWLDARFTSRYVACRDS